MRRRIGRIAFVIAILGSLVAVDAGEDAAQAAGASISDIGWWSRTPSTTTPAGGFQIAKGPDGDKSVAAVRIAIDGSLTQALLILAETTGGFLQESAVIDACPTVAPWAAAVAGPFEEAPEADCTRKLAVQRDATTGSWTVDLMPLVEPGATSLAVVLRPGVVAAVVAPSPPTIPAPVPLPAPAEPVPTPVDPGFTTEFSKADIFAGGVEAPAASGPSGSASGSGSGTGTIASGGGTTTFAPTFSPTDSFASTTQFASLDPTPGALPAATPSVAASGAGGVGTAASVESGLQPVAATRGPGAPWGRLLILVPLSLAIGALGTGARRTLGGRSLAEALGR